MSRHSLFCVFAVLVQLTAFANTARADGRAYYCDTKERKDVAVMIEGGGCAGFTVINEHDTERVYFDTLISGTLLVSDDRRRAVAINSSVYGHMTKDGKIFSYDVRQGRYEEDPVALLIYSNGRLLARYRLSEIIVRPRLVELSMSHVDWLQKMSGFEESAGRKLVLETKSLRHIEFDLDTGHISRQSDSREWNTCDVIARGPVARLQPVSQMNPASIIKGAAAAILDFKIAPQANIESGRNDQTVCLRSSKTGLLAISTIPVNYNGLPEATREIGFSTSLEEAGDSHDPWKLQFTFDAPIRAAKARLAGTDKWNDGVFSAPNGSGSYDAVVAATVAFDHLPENASIDVRYTDEAGKESEVNTSNFDTKMAVQGLLYTRLKHRPHPWLQTTIAGGGARLNFGALIQSRCAVQEVRYSIDSQQLDKRFPVPPCDFASPSGGDYNPSITLTKVPDYVASKVVFVNGEESQIEIEHIDK
jgi:hypothetical protein